MADEIERQGTMPDNEGEFRKWLKTREKDKTPGEKLLHISQNAYANSIKKSVEIFPEEYKPYTNVFNIDDPHEFDEIVKKVKANKKAYHDYNVTRENRRFSSVIKKYRAFLDGEGPKVGSHEGGRYGGLTYDEYHGPQPPPPPPPLPPTKEPRNLIFFGAPGTGKSYRLNDRSKKLLRGNDESIRVTFHPDYSYAHFVGTYKPVPEGSEITYKYVPGPFMETYVKAVENPNNRYLLIIEEINRANVAAVFGDVFQLLDRTEAGESEYPVKASKDIRDYLEKDVDDNKKTRWDPAGCREIRIPANMYIWATMNSADQGVFPMDTAFKRRWEFEYLPITTGQDAEIIRDAMVPMGNKNEMIKWNDARKYINDLLARLGINEDKQLGAFFINADIIANAAAGKEGGDRFKDTFKDKVLMYLFEDAAKHKRKEVFGTNENNGNKRYSEIRDAFDLKGMGVFKGWKEETNDGKTKTGGTGGTDGTTTPEGDAGEREP